MEGFRLLNRWPTMMHRDVLGREGIGMPGGDAGERLRRLCRQAGRQSLSYLGVRLGSQDYPVLKGYADFV